MNRHLLLFIAVFSLLVSWFNNFRHYLRTWFANLRSKLSVAHRMREKQESSMPISQHNQNQTVIASKCQNRYGKNHLPIVAEATIITEVCRK